MKKLDADAKQPFPYSEQSHAVQFYTDDTFLLDGLCEFVRDALTEGEPVVLVVTKKHRNGLTKRLRECGVDVSEAMKTNRVMVLDAAETLSKFMDGKSPNQRRFFSVVGSIIRRAESHGDIKHKRVAVFGEMVALLWAEKKFEAAIRLEQLWNELSKTHFFYLRCAYPVSGFQGKLKGEPYAAVCAEHSTVIPTEGYA
jgi:uroporphyrinogen-III synthase